MPDERPGRRAFQIYLYAVCLVTVVVVLFSTASAVYAIIRIAAPGTTAQGGDSGFGFPGIIEGGGSGFSRGVDAGDAERDAGIASLAENGIFALAAAAIFWWHWQQAAQLRAEISAESRPRAAAPKRTRARRT